MQQGYAIIGEQIAHLAEECRIIGHAHMLEHAHRHDAVERALQRAVIDEFEFAAV